MPSTNQNRTAGPRTKKPFTAGSDGFKINAVSKLTGVSADVLRAWERRYGAVAPFRSPGGTRLYTQADIWRLTLLRQGVAKGHQIGQIVELSNEALEKLRSARDGRPVSTDPHQAVVDRFLHAVSKIDVAAAEAEIVTASAIFSIDDLVEKVFAQILKAIGDFWQHGEFGIAEEHLASNILREVMLIVARMKRSADAGSQIVLATLPGERHELGLLLSSLAASAAGWRTIHLGVETPAEEIARATRLTGASAVGISLVAPESSLIRHELEKLSLFLPRSITVLIGGRGALQYLEVFESLEWRVTADFDALRSTLSTML